ncbi:MAG: hypothetical protein ACKOC6_04445 [bacterium]
MRLEKKALVLAAIMAVLSAPQSRAVNVVQEPAQHAFDVVVDGAPNRPAPSGAQLITTVYDNSDQATSPTATAFSNTAVTTHTWGDELFLTSGGLLSEMKFSLFNSGSSAGTLLTATVAVELLNAATSASLGSFSTVVGFGATGLGQAQYSVVTVTNLESLSILLSTTNVLVKQRITAKTGTASRTGIASLDPPVVGSSPAYFFQSSPTVTAGFYTATSGKPVNVLYQIAVTPPPVPARSTSWSRVKKLYR